MNIDFKNDEILFLEGETGIVGIIKVAYENKMLFNNRRDIERKAQSPVVIKNKTFRVNQTVRDKEKLSFHSSTPSLSEKKLIGSNLSKSQSKIKLKKINISHKKCLSSVNSMNKFQI